MTVAVAESRRNGTGAAMPIKQTVVRFDELGYPGWCATLRTNPRASVYDDFVSNNDERLWSALSVIVLEWNFADEQGVPLPLPGKGLTLKDLPWDLLKHLVSRYIDEFNAAAIVPKALSDNSVPISSTSEGSLKSE